MQVHAVNIYLLILYTYCYEPGLKVHLLPITGGELTYVVMCCLTSEYKQTLQIIITIKTFNNLLQANLC